MQVQRGVNFNQIDPEATVNSFSYSLIVFDFAPDS